METEFKVLKDLGLTNNQIKIYLALLELGEASSGDILKKAGLHNSVVYYGLNELIEMGLVSFVLKGKIKYFSTSNLSCLLKIVDEKRNRVEEIIPLLKEKEKFSKGKSETQVYSGWSGIYAVFNSIFDELDKGSEYLAFAAGFEKQFSEKSKKFFKEFQRKRDEMKYDVKLIANKEAREQIENYDYFEKFSKPRYRLVDGIAPLGLIIYGDNILQVSFKDDVFAVNIKSKALAENYRKMFYNLWKIGEEV